MDRKTTFITAAAVTGVVLAGTTAIAANIGILDAADDGNVGNLSATAVVETVPTTVPTAAEPQIIDVYIEEPGPAVGPTTNELGSEAESQLQEFNVDVAGAVAIKQTDDAILLDRVTANEGWEWTSSQSSPTELVVAFTSGDAEFVFFASVAEDGSIAARVDQPIVNIVQVPAVPTANAPVTPAPTVTAPLGGDDRYDDDDHDDDDDDDHDDDHDDDDDEHEGGDDDD